MNAQMINIVFFGKGHCIIQIFCIFSIYGHCLPVCKIHTAIPVSLQHMIRHPGCLIHNFYRKFGRYIITFHNGKNVCSRSIHTAQILFDPAFRLVPVIAIIKNLCNYLVSIPYSFGILRRYIDVFGKFLIVTDDKSIIPFSLESSYNLLIGTFQNPYHRSFLAFSFLFSLFQKYLYFVLVHGSSGCICRNKNIIFLFFQFHKTKSLVVADKGSFFDKAKFLKFSYGLFFRLLY